MWAAGGRSVSTPPPGGGSGFGVGSAISHTPGAEGEGLESGHFQRKFDWVSRHRGPAPPPCYGQAPGIFLMQKFSKNLIFSKAFFKRFSRFYKAF